MAHVDISWVALECRRRQEGPEDEVAGFVSAVCGRGTEKHFYPGDRDTFSMGPSGQRIVQVDVPLYSGPPVPLGLTAHLVEHDSGDLEGYKQRASEAISATASQALSAGAGMALPVLDELVDDLARGLVDAVFEFVGTADDPYNAQRKTLDLADFVAHPRRRETLRRNDDPHAVDYTPLGPPQDIIVLTGRDDGGDIGEYGFYFDVRVSGVSDPVVPDEPGAREPTPDPRPVIPGGGNGPPDPGPVDDVVLEQ